MRGAPTPASAWRNTVDAMRPPARNRSQRRAVSGGSVGRRSRNRMAAKIGARRLSGARTAASSASNRSGAARSAASAPAERVVVAPGQGGAAHRRLEHPGGVGERRLLADHHPADHEVMRARDLAEIGQHVRLAGAEAAGDTQAARRGALRPDRAQQLVERVLDAGLGGAHQAHRGAVRHAGAQGLDGGAGFQVHPLTVTSGASGFCRSPGRTSGQMRISSAL